MWISDPENYVAERLEIARKVLSRCTKSDRGCFEWQGASNGKGYGRMRIGDKVLSTHRIMAYASGKLSQLKYNRNQIILHLCDNPKCCRPSHLKVGTYSQNVRQIHHGLFCADICAKDLKKSSKKIEKRKLIPRNLKRKSTWSERQDSNLRPPRPER